MIWLKLNFTCETVSAAKDETLKVVDVDPAVDEIDAVDVPHLKSAGKERGRHFPVAVGAFLAQNGHSGDVVRMPGHCHSNRNVRIETQMILRSFTVGKVAKLLTDAVGVGLQQIQTVTGFFP